MSKDVHFSTRMPEDLKEALQRRADADDRKLAAYVVRVLKEHVERTPEPSAGKAAKTRKS